MPRHSGLRHGTGKVARRRRVNLPLFPFVAVGMIASVLLINFLLFTNFSNNCEDMGGEASIMWSGRGGFKCTDDEGHIIDIL